jgi:hypothetical protein
MNQNLTKFTIFLPFFHRSKATLGRKFRNRFSVAPDDGELAEWSARLHRKHILLSLKSTSAIPPSTMDTADFFRSLAASITCTTEEAKNQNRI